MTHGGGHDGSEGAGAVRGAETGRPVVSPFSRVQVLWAGGPARAAARDSSDVPALSLAGCLNDNVVSALLLGRNAA